MQGGSPLRTQTIVDARRQNVLNRSQVGDRNANDDCDADASKDLGCAVWIEAADV
jgi:hypothetical protein